MVEEGSRGEPPAGVALGEVTNLSTTIAAPTAENATSPALGSGPQPFGQSEAVQSPAATTHAAIPWSIARRAFRKIAAPIARTASSIGKNAGNTPRIAPPAAATPLPPRKPVHTGQT